MSNPPLFIECLDGFTIRVGQQVDFHSNHGTMGRGTVRELRGDRALLDVTEVIEQGGDRWPLNPLAAERAGRSDYFGPRDQGVSFGCIRRPSEKWAGF